MIIQLGGELKLSKDHIINLYISNCQYFSKYDPGTYEGSSRTLSRNLKSQNYFYYNTKTLSFPFSFSYESTVEFSRGFMTSNKIFSMMANVICAFVF